MVISRVHAHLLARLSFARRHNSTSFQREMKSKGKLSLPPVALPAVPLHQPEAAAPPWHFAPPIYREIISVSISPICRYISCHFCRPIQSPTNWTGRVVVIPTNAEILHETNVTNLDVANGFTVDNARSAHSLHVTRRRQLGTNTYSLRDRRVVSINWRTNTWNKNKKNETCADCQIFKTSQGWWQPRKVSLQRCTSQKWPFDMF